MVTGRGGEGGSLKAAGRKIIFLDRRGGSRGRNGKRNKKTTGVKKGEKQVSLRQPAGAGAARRGRIP